MKTLFTLIVLILIASTCFAANSMTSISVSGKTPDGIVWRNTVRDFTPGATEVELQFGKVITKEITVLGDYLENDKGAKFVGTSLCLTKSFGTVKGAVNVNYYVGLGGTANKLKVTGGANQPLGKSWYVGYGFLATKSDDKPSYFEAGPQVGYKYDRYYLNLQVVRSNTKKEVINTSFSVAF